MSLLFAGCTQPSDRVLVTAREESGVELLAIVAGVLEISKDNCVVLRHNDGVALAVFPRGSELEEEDVVLPSGTRLPLGSEFDGNGGWFHVDELPTVEVPAQCHETMIALINNAG